jgi:hypothetical protein
MSVKMFARQGFGRLAMPFLLRKLVLAAVALLAMGISAGAQDGPVTGAPQTVALEPWQEVISGQIQAFRDHDASVAFGYAGAGFQTTFPNAETFFNAIVTSGYAPIMESRSHSFGQYQMTSADGVVQEVRFTGRDQSIYRAVYQLTVEPEGWRVQGVQLLKEAGIAI